MANAYVGGSRTRRLAMGLLVAAALSPAAAQAGGVYAGDGCKLDTPADWVVSKSRTSTPDKKLWATLMSAPSAAQIVQIESGLKATKVSEDARLIVMVSSASAFGMTNRQYHAITKTTPSCLADVTSPAGPQEATAKAIAMTVRPAK